MHFSRPQKNFAYASRQPNAEKKTESGKSIIKNSPTSVHPASDAETTFVHSGV